MKIYLDTSVIIPMLLGENTDSRHRDSKRLLEKIANGKLKGYISLYSFSELINYIEEHFDENLTHEVFRESMVELLSYPLNILKYPDRNELSFFRRKFTISDSSDVLHVVLDLKSECKVIVTYDTHFQEVKDVIGVNMPEEVKRKV
ncbi:MAG: PIN domain-containing protein [bacterium]|nr:PIN domain-containing protein [bacterium]